MNDTGELFDAVRVAPEPRPVGPSAWRMRDPRRADPTGLVGFGADLAPATLVDAYRRGIFPWPHEGVDLPWFSPDPRGVLVPDDVRVARSLRGRLRNCGWQTTVDASFDEVIEACADRPADQGTWINRRMRDAYGELHRLGWAHSLEVWSGPDLVGGLYGVAVGACFTGESMFHRVTDASKVALVDFLDRWRAAGGELFDVQLPTDHLCRMGVTTMPRPEFLDRLAALRDRHVPLRLDRRDVSNLAR